MSSEKTYADESIEYNDLAWAILSDEQVATALLDYADLMLAQYGPQIDKLLENLPSSITQYITWDSNSRTLKLNAFGLVKKDIPVRTHSVDELFFLTHMVTYSVMPATLTLRLLLLRIGILQEKLHLQLIF